jgi:uridine monophosphate synthetase
MATTTAAVDAPAATGAAGKVRENWGEQVSRRRALSRSALSLTTLNPTQQNKHTRPQTASVADFEDLVLDLHAIEAVKFGSFTLKSGLTSPVYLDLRVIVSHPAILARVAAAMWAAAVDKGGAAFDVMCGVPYTALPIATAMSLEHGTPMLMRRKEAKAYGTKKVIEGAVKPGDTCLVVEDLVTSGASVMETVDPLTAEGLKVTDVVVLIDREQGGAARMASNGLRLHSAFTLSALLDVLVREGKVEERVAADVRAFIAANQTFDKNVQGGGAVPAPAPPAPPARLPWSARAAAAANPAGRALFELMDRKRTNLAIAADVSSTDAVLALAESTGPHIAVFKTHVDALDRWTADDAGALAASAAKHDFMIFEDRKFADIGNTVVSQYGGGIYKIADWAHITNAHLVPGPGIIDGLKQVGASKGRGLLLLAEMSSKGSLATGAYTEAVAAAAEAHPDFVCGFISQSPASWPTAPSPGLVHMTPGVQLAAGGDGLGQQYNTPSSVIGRGGSDVIIVGRGIVAAPDPSAAAAEYRAAGWAAYEEALAAGGGGGGATA